MYFERLKTTEDKRYAEAMELYRKSFPPHEQRPTASQAEIMGKDEYQFNLVCDEGQPIGILLCWETESFLYVEHFCVRPELRNKRYGQRALELLNRRGKPVILEIDPPIDDVSRRRQGFYERAGYTANGFEHIHPPYRQENPGHRLVVMSYPGGITEELYAAFAQYLKNTVMRL